MQNKNKFLAMLISLLVFLSFSSNANADDWYDEEKGYYTMFDEAGQELTMMAGEMFLKDEYISSDNKHYTITRVDKNGRKAYAKYLGDIKLPEVEESDASISSFLSEQQGRRSVLIYCTHTDESYVPSDGKASIPAKGGVLDVGETLGNSLKKKGVRVVFDKTPHDPHDAAAYRRSRQTAIKLIKQNMPVAAVFDIHRDAVPKSAYVTKVNGEDMAKVRIVLGARNQNRQANQELAYKIKAVADKVYPGLIKDIYIGRGQYNQELSPRSLILEFGTYENSKEAAQKAAAYMADVLQKALFGGRAQAQSQTGENKGRVGVTPINQERTQGGARGILWVIGLLVVGGIGYILLSSGGREMFSKLSNFTRQEFSSFLGRKKKK